MYRVVIADDECEARGWLRKLLKQRDDFQVVGEASTGTEALGLVSLLKPDLVISDLYMPDGDGIEVIRSVKCQSPDTKVILISAHNGRAYERLGMEEKALAFIPKTSLSLDALHYALKEEE